MNPSREEALFALALTKPAAERASWLDCECGEDKGLRARLDALLAAHEQPEDSLATGAAPAASVTIKLDFPNEPADEAVGQTLGRYKLLEKVGEGGCGVVYVAEQTEPVRRRVALKVIKLGMDTKQVVARFEAERQALAMMDHPNIAKVLDAGTTGPSDSSSSGRESAHSSTGESQSRLTSAATIGMGRPYFVMELVRGIKITDYCDQANLSTKDRLDLFIKVCQAIQHAHQKGIIHRDIKPSNILVTLHDGVPVPKVIDFGIAKATEGRLTDATVYTQLHQFIGTPAYMSPEQAEMSGLDIDTRSDIYSLGVLLYELLTGKTPFDAQELMSQGIDAMRKTIREKDPVRPSTKLATLQGEELTTTAKRRSVESSKLAKLLRGDLDWIVMKCLEKDRTRRYDTANGLAADIKRHLNNEPVVARPPSKLYEFQKTFRRHKLGFAATGALIAVLLAGVVVSSWQAARARRAEREQSRLRVTAQAAEVDARTKQSEAEIERKRADEETAKARENQELSRRLLYASDINLAQQALTLNNLGRARRLVDRHRPNPGEEDLRGWEWRYLWQLTRSEALTTLVNRPTYGTDICFSPDGSQIAVAWLDGRIDLWNVAARKSTRQLSPANNSAPGRVAFSPTANLLAANSEPGTVKLYDLDAGKELFLWTAPDDAGWIVKDLAFSQDGSRVVIYGECVAKGVSSIWVANISGRSENRFPSRFYMGWAEMGAARLSADNRRLYLETPGGDCSIQCLDLITGKELWRTEALSDGALTALAVSPDGRILASATGFEDSAIRLWNAETGKRLDRLNGHTAWVSDLEFTKDGKRLISASSDQTIRYWDTHDWTETRVLRGHTDEVHTLAISETAKLIASVSKNGDLMLWQMNGKGLAQGYTRLPDTLGAQSVLPLDNARALALRGSSPPALIDFNEDLRPHVLPGLDAADSFLSLTDTNLICHWDGTNQVVVSELRGMKLIRRGGITIESGKRPAAALYDPKHDLLAWTEAPPSMLVQVASFDGAAKRIELKRDFPEIIPIQINSSGTHMVGWTRWGPLNVWNVHSATTVISHRGRFSTASFAAGGRVLVTVEEIGNDHEIAFYDLARPAQPMRQITGRDRANGLAISPDGSLAAVSTHVGLLELYNPTNGTLISSLHGHLNSAHSIAFSRDGQRLISASGGREALKLWDVSTRQELLNLSGVGGALDKPVWSGDGHVLLVSWPWQAWSAPSWEEIAAVEAKAKEEVKAP